MELFSDKKLDTKVSNLKLTTPQDKPLVVFLSWLLAKRKSSLKYIDIYVDQGFDVLHVTITPWQLLWPKKGTQVRIINYFRLFFLSEDSVEMWQMACN